jgi:hypothetical protein
MARSGNAATIAAQNLFPVTLSGLRLPRANNIDKSMTTTMIMCIASLRNPPEPPGIASPESSRCFIGERLFSRLKDWRQFATRYDKLARNFLAVVQLAAAIIWWT